MVRFITRFYYTQPTLIGVSNNGLAPLSGEGRGLSVLEIERQSSCLGFHIYTGPHYWGQVSADGGVNEAARETDRDAHVFGQSRLLLVEGWEPITDKEDWRPQGVLAWLLTVVACLLVVIMAGLAYCMAYPVRWDGFGKLGAVALYFPLHLLVATLVAAVLVFFAWRWRARLAAAVFSLVGDPDGDHGADAGHRRVAAGATIERAAVARHLPGECGAPERRPSAARGRTWSMARPRTARSWSWLCGALASPITALCDRPSCLCMVGR